MKFSRNLLVHLPGTYAQTTAGAAATPRIQRGNKKGDVAAAARRTSVTPRPRIGIWDLGAWLSTLPQLVDRLNSVQRSFSFFVVQAMVPAGLIREREGVIAWFTEFHGRALKKMEREELMSNVIANDFYPIAERVRGDLQIDYLIGVTPCMVAGEDKHGSPYWNYFSTFKGRVALASSADLRKFSAKSGHPLEAYLGIIIVAQVLMAIFPNLGYHDDNGCLFDFNEDRDGIVNTLKNLHVDRECLDAIPAKDRAAVQSLVNLLRNYPTS